MPSPFAALQTAYKKTQNLINGQTFNRDAWEETHKDMDRKIIQEDFELNPAFDNEEEWTGVTSVRTRIPDFEYFSVREMDLSEMAAQKACEALGVTREYLSYAMKFVAMEAAKDIGWVANTKTVADVVRATRKRFPILDDLKKAYDEGGAFGQRRRADTQNSRYLQASTAIPASAASASPMSTNPNVKKRDKKKIPPLQNPIYNPYVHADLEVVPAGDEMYSSEEDAMNERAAAATRMNEESMRPVGLRDQTIESDDEY